MHRSRALAALVRLPALARAQAGRTAQRYVQRQVQAIGATLAGRKRRPRRTDGIRELSVTSIYRAARNQFSRGTSVPYVRMSGKWLERCGFADGTRVFVRAESGRLVLTIDDPALASSGEERG